MDLWLASALIAGSTAVMVAAMLLIRRRAPEGGYFKDVQRATGVFGFTGTAFVVLLGFAVLLTFESYSNAKEKSASEGTAVFEEFNAADSFQPVKRDALQGELECYAGAVINDEWLTMKSGARSPKVGEWIYALERETGTIKAKTMREDRALQEFLDNESVRDESRRERLLESSNVLPALLWIMLILGAVIVLGFVLYFADPAESAPAQSMLAGAATALVVTSLLAVALLASPFKNGNGSIKPVSMSYTLMQMQKEVAEEGRTLSLPCDARGTHV